MDYTKRSYPRRCRTTARRRPAGELKTITVTPTSTLTLPSVLSPGPYSFFQLDASTPPLFTLQSNPLLDMNWQPPTQQPVPLPPPVQPQFNWQLEVGKLILRCSSHLLDEQIKWARRHSDLTEEVLATLLKNFTDQALNNC
jgi:hypothetical protein